MPILNIRDLGSAGVVSDIAPWDLPPAALSAGINFRLASGKVQTAGGIEMISESAGKDLGHITQSTDLRGNSSWLACSGESVLVFDGYGFNPLTGVGQLSVDPSKWTSAKIGNVTFLNNAEHYPMFWTDLGGLDHAPLEYLPWHIGEQTWQDAGMSCNIIRAHKNFLFALGMKNPDGQFNDMLHWSHPAEPNGIPFSWRPTIDQPDSIAGSLSLGRGGAIVGGESLRDSFVVYSEEALNVLDFTGDALGWRRRAISETAGLVSPNAIVEAKGMHIFFTGEDVLAFDGNSMQSLMHNRLRTRLASSINNDALHTAWAAHFQIHNEVWIGVAENGAAAPNVAYCFNYRDNTWSIRSLEKEVAHASAGREPKSAYSTWDSYQTTWADERGSWVQAGQRPFRDVMLGLAEQHINDIDPDTSTAGGGVGDYLDLSWDGANYDAWDRSLYDWDNAMEPWDSPPIRASIQGDEEKWDDTSSKWMQDTRNWDDAFVQLPDVDEERTWRTTPESWDDFGESARRSRTETWLQRTDMPIAGHENNTTITRIYPHVEGTATLEFRFGSQQHAGGPVKWAGGPREFTAGKDRKIDVRTTGELHAYEVRSKGGFFKLTGMDIEFSPAGGR